MSLSRLANPTRFLLALLLETGGDPSSYSLRLEVVEGGRELEQLHAGCYLDSVLLYGGRVEGGELVGATDGGELWQDLGLVKVTPVETARMRGARVVQVMLLLLPPYSIPTRAPDLTSYSFLPGSPSYQTSPRQPAGGRGLSHSLHQHEG